MNIDRIAFFTYSQDVSALEQYRIVSPLTQAGIDIVPGIRDGKLLLESINEAPLVLFQRDFSRSFSDYLQVLERAHIMGKPVVLDLDDHLIALPKDHPDRISGYYADGLTALLHALINVDAITVATQALKEALLPYNPHIYVLPNYLDENLWHFREPKLMSNPLTVRILYVGTPTHNPDLELIADPLARITRKYENEVTVLFYGANPPESISDQSNVTHYPLQTYDYRKFIADYQQIEADIAIAPLVDNKFNRCKSFIKYFEYTANGLPGVFSSIPPYSEIINDDNNGFLAMNEEEWEQKLETLIENPSLRLEIAQNAQEQIKQHWLIQQHANQWNEAYQQILADGIQTPNIDPVINKTLGSISEQLQEYRDLVSLQKLQLSDAQIHELTLEIEGLNQKLVEAEENLRAKDARTQEMTVEIEGLNQKLVEAEENLRAKDARTQEMTVEIEGLNQKLVEAEENLRAKDARTQEMTVEIEGLNQKLVEAEENLGIKDKIIEQLKAESEMYQKEIVDYVTSTSWKMTRPFRKISKRLGRGKNV
jgi:glycosyltransferase involved in cell wall biosynthesis/uncharacterized protein YdcH (DUF465 family)